MYTFFYLHIYMQLYINYSIHYLSAKTSAGVHSESAFNDNSLRCFDVSPAVKLCFSSSRILVLTQPDILSTPPAYFKRTYRRKIADGEKVSYILITNKFKG